MSTLDDIRVHGANETYGQKADEGLTTGELLQKIDGEREQLYETEIATYDPKHKDIAIRASRMSQDFLKSSIEKQTLEADQYKVDNEGWLGLNTPETKIHEGMVSELDAMSKMYAFNDKNKPYRSGLKLIEEDQRFYGPGSPTPQHDPATGEQIPFGDHIDPKTGQQVGTGPLVDDKFEPYHPWKFEEPDTRTHDPDPTLPKKDDTSVFKFEDGWDPSTGVTKDLTPESKAIAVGAAKIAKLEGKEGLDRYHNLVNETFNKPMSRKDYVRTDLGRSTQTEWWLKNKAPLPPEHKMQRAESDPGSDVSFDTGTTEADKVYNARIRALNAEMDAKYDVQLGQFMAIAVYNQKIKNALYQGNADDAEDLMKQCDALAHAYTGVGMTEEHLENMPSDETVNEIRVKMQERNAQAQADAEAARDHEVSQMPLHEKVGHFAQRWAWEIASSTRDAYVAASELATHALQDEYFPDYDPIATDTLMGDAVDEWATKLDRSALTGTAWHEWGSVVGTSTAFMLGSYWAKAFTTAMTAGRIGRLTAAVSSAKGAANIARAKVRLEKAQKMVGLFEKMSALGTSGMVGTGVSYRGMYRHAIEAGVPRKQARKLIWTAVASGSLEGLPINFGLAKSSSFNRLMEAVNRGSKGKLIHAIMHTVRTTGANVAESGVQEAIQEGLQQLTENYGEKAVWDFTREITDGWGEAAAMGGTFGAVMSVILGTLGRWRGARAAQKQGAQIEEFNEILASAHEEAMETSDEEYIEKFQQSVEVEEQKLAELKEYKRNNPDDGDIDAEIKDASEALKQKKEVLAKAQEHKAEQEQEAIVVNEKGEAKLPGSAGTSQAEGQDKPAKTDPIRAKKAFADSDREISRAREDNDLEALAVAAWRLKSRASKFGDKAREAQAYELAAEAATQGYGVIDPTGETVKEGVAQKDTTYTVVEWKTTSNPDDHRKVTKVLKPVITKDGKPIKAGEVVATEYTKEQPTSTTKPASKPTPPKPYKSSFDHQTDLAKAARKEGVDLTKMTRLEYARYAIDNGARIDKAAIRMQPSLRTFEGDVRGFIAAMNAMRKTHDTDGKGNKEFNDWNAEMHRLSENLLNWHEANKAFKKGKGADPGPRPSLDIPGAGGARIKANNSQESKYIFAQVGKGKQTAHKSSDTYKAYVGLKEVGKQLTKSRAVAFLKALQDAGINADVKFIEDTVFDSTSRDQIVIHGDKATAHAAEKVAKTFWGSELDITEIGRDGPLKTGDHTSYSGLIEENINDQIDAAEAAAAAPTSTTSTSTKKDAAANLKAAQKEEAEAQKAVDDLQDEESEGDHQTELDKVFAAQDRLDKAREDREAAEKKVKEQPTSSTSTTESTTASNSGAASKVKQDKAAEKEKAKENVEAVAEEVKTPPVSKREQKRRQAKIDAIKNHPHFRNAKVRANKDNTQVVVEIDGFAKPLVISLRTMEEMMGPIIAEVKAGHPENAAESLYAQFQPLVEGKKSLHEMMGFPRTEPEFLKLKPKEQIALIKKATPEGSYSGLQSGLSIKIPGTNTTVDTAYVIDLLHAGSIIKAGDRESFNDAHSHEVMHWVWSEVYTKDERKMLTEQLGGEEQWAYAYGAYAAKAIRNNTIDQKPNFIRRMFHKVMDFVANKFNVFEHGAQQRKVNKMLRDMLTGKVIGKAKPSATEMDAVTNISKSKLGVQGRHRYSLKSKANIKKDVSVLTAAAKYARSIGKTINPVPETTLTPEKAARVAELYDQMKHDPTDPAVASAYAAFNQETLDQYNFLLAEGYTFDLLPVEVVAELYPDVESLATDILENKHLSVNDDPGNMPDDHPINQPAPGLPGMTYNHVFRAVHDIFGHARTGYSFSVEGEELAWRGHRQMYSDEAQGILATETRGQSSWVGHNKVYGAANLANVEKGDIGAVIFPAQKAGLMPEAAYNEASQHKLVTKDRTPELQAAAQDIAAGLGVTREEYAKLVDKFKRVRLYKGVPTPASRADLVRGLTTPQSKKIGAARSLPQGFLVGLRLDIKAYLNHQVWAPTMHWKERRAGQTALDRTSHQSVAAINDATFAFKTDDGALGIAAGAAKWPLATINGKLDKLSQAAIMREAKAALNDPAWTQVGMDPERHSFFYNRANHRQALKSADRVLQVGPLVLAKNATFDTKTDYKYKLTTRAEYVAHEMRNTQNPIAYLAQTGEIEGLGGLESFVGGVDGGENLFGDPDSAFYQTMGSWISEGHLVDDWWVTPLDDAWDEDPRLWGQILKDALDTLGMPKVPWTGKDWSFSDSTLLAEETMDLGISKLVEVSREMKALHDVHGTPKSREFIKRPSHNLLDFADPMESFARDYDSLQAKHKLTTGSPAPDEIADLFDASEAVKRAFAGIINILENPGMINVAQISRSRSPSKQGENRVNNFEIATHLSELLTAAGIDRRGHTADELKALKRSDMDDMSAHLAMEALLALSKDTTGAIGWYNEKVEEALTTMAEFFPSIAADADGNLTKDGMIFRAILAVTSDGENVIPNFTNASEIFMKYQDTGVIEGSGKRPSIATNLSLINTLIRVHDWRKVSAFLTKEYSVHELEKYGWEVSGEAKKDAVYGEIETTKSMVKGAMIFGPKLGSFFGNLSGEYDTITMDLWWSRTISRIRNAMITATPEAVSNAIWIGTSKVSSLVSTLNEDLIARTKIGKNPDGSPAYYQMAELQQGVEGAEDKLLTLALALAGANGTAYTQSAESKIIEWIQDPEHPVHKDTPTIRLGSEAALKLQKNLFYKLEKGGLLIDGKNAPSRKVINAAISIAMKMQAAVGTPMHKRSMGVRDKLLAMYVIPQSGGDRNIQRDIASKAMELFDQHSGNEEKITPADFQALLWNYEKSIWTALGAKLQGGVDYAEAAIAVIEGTLNEKTGEREGGLRSRLKKINGKPAELIINKSGQLEYNPERTRKKKSTRKTTKSGKQSNKQFARSDAYDTEHQALQDLVDKPGLINTDVKLKKGAKIPNTGVRRADGSIVPGTEDRKPDGTIIQRNAKATSERTYTEVAYKLTTNLSVSTDSIPVIDALQQRASAGDVAAAQAMGDIATTSMKYFLGGIPQEHIKTYYQEAFGVYEASYEPALQVVVDVDPEYRDAAMAAAAQLGVNFNQWQVHLRDDADMDGGFRHQYGDGSHNTAVYTWDLKDPASVQEVKDVIENTEAIAMTVIGNQVEMYYGANIDDESGIEQFERSIDQVFASLGSGLSSPKQKVERLYIYGANEGDIPYESVTDKLRPGTQKQRAVTNKLIEARLNSDAVKHSLRTNARKGGVDPDQVRAEAARRKAEREAGREPGPQHLANPIRPHEDTSDEDYAEARDAGAAVIDTQGQPVSRPMEQVMEDVLAMEARTPDLYDRAKMVMEDEITLSELDTHQVMARRVIAKLLAKSRNNTGDLELAESDYALAINTQNALHNSRTHIARGLAIGADPNADPADVIRDALVEAVATPTFDQRQSLDKIDEAINKQPHGSVKREALLKKRHAMLKKYSKGLHDIRDMFAQVGVDLNDLKDFASPKKAARLMRHIQASKANFGDKLYEYWINTILSSPTTHIRNIAGNIVFGAWEMTAQKMMEVVVNRFTPGNRTEAAMFGELKYIWKGLGPGLSKGFEKAMVTWQIGSPMEGDKLELKDTRAAIGQGWRWARYIVPGRDVGEFFRIPTRLLAMEDNFNKAIVTEITLGQYAYRLAMQKNHKTKLDMKKLRNKGDVAGSNALKKELLTGQSLTDFLVEQTTNPKSKAAELAKEEALRLTWQNEIDEGPKKVVNALRNAGIPGISKWVPAADGRWFLPFVTTPYNIMKTGVRKTPLGSLNMLFKGLRTQLEEGYDYSRSEKIRDFSEQIWAGLLMMAIWSMVQPDPDDPENRPHITGTGKTDYRERAYQYESMPPFTIRIGDTELSYKFIEPFATMLGLMADAALAFKDAKNGATAKRVHEQAFQSALSTVTDKTFLKGIGDLMKAFKGEGKGAGKWASNFAASWVPNVLRGVGRATEDEFPESYIYQSDQFGTAYWRQWRRSTAAKAFPGNKALQARFAGEPAMPSKIDMFGETVEVTNMDYPLGDFLWKLFSPVSMHDASPRETSGLYRWMNNWNDQNPNEKYTGSQVDGQFRHNGVEYIVDDDLLAEARQVAGNRARDILLRTRLHPNKPKPYELDIFKNAFKTGSRDATNTVFIYNTKLGKTLKELEDEGRIVRKK